MKQRKDIAVSKASEEKLTREQYVAVSKATRAQVLREYCDYLQFWRGCRYKPCRRARACRGDQQACFSRGIQGVPADLQRRAHQHMVATTPPDAKGPARSARWTSPSSLG